MATLIPCTGARERPETRPYRCSELTPSDPTSPSGTVFSMVPGRASFATRAREGVPVWGTYPHPKLSEHDARTTVAQLSTTLAAVARVGAAAGAFQPAREDMGTSAARLDALVVACQEIARVDHVPAGGLIPSPGSLADAVNRWRVHSEAALAPGEVDGRTLRFVSADLRYLHAATTVLLNATDATPFDGSCLAGLRKAEQAWAKVQQAWPPQLSTQPGGRLCVEQLHAA